MFSDDLTRDVYRNMTNKELASLRDKMHSAGEHAPFFLAELRRRGIPPTPEPTRTQATPRYKPTPRSRQPRQSAPAAPPRQAHNQPQAQSQAQARVLSTLRQLGNQPQQRPPLPPQQQRPHPPQGQSQQQRPLPVQGQSHHQGPQRPIPLVKTPPPKKKGCGCATAIIFIIAGILIRLLIEHGGF